MSTTLRISTPKRKRTRRGSKLEWIAFTVWHVSLAYGCCWLYMNRRPQIDTFLQSLRDLLGSLI